MVIGKMPTVPSLRRLACWLLGHRWDTITYWTKDRPQHEFVGVCCDRCGRPKSVTDHYVKP